MFPYLHEDHVSMCHLMERLAFAVMPFILATMTHGQGMAWEPRADMPAPRWGSSSFVINGLAYVVGGKSGSLEYSQMWAYDPLNNTWTPKAPIPGARRQAMAFAINGKGYVGCGLINNANFLSDVWEYDPQTDAWNQKAPFPGGARYNMWHFAINGIAYVGGGNSAGANGPFHTDSFMYDPTTDTWSTGYPIPDQGRHGAVGFELGGYGYVVCGRENDLTFSQDLWRFDPQTLSWTAVTPFPGAPRSSPLALPFFNDVVVACGRDGSLNHFDGWRYDPPTDTWSTIPDYPGATAMAGVSFSIGGRSFAGLGWNLATDLAHNDLWELVRMDVTNYPMIQSKQLLVALPNLVVDGICVLRSSHPGPIHTRLFDTGGRQVGAWSFFSEEQLALHGLPSGSYTLHWYTMEGSRGVLPIAIQ